MSIGMFYRLEIENFFSIRERQVMDLRVGRSVKGGPEKFAPLFPGSNERAPKVVALYGANASGKTTILRALAFLQWFLSKSLVTNDGWWLAGFNDQEFQSRPVFVALEFSGQNGLTTEDIKTRAASGQPFSLYRYELCVELVDGSPKRVLREALHQKPMGKGKWVRIFDRDAVAGTTGSHLFPLTKASRLIADQVRPDVSLVTTLIKNVEHPAAQAVFDAASQVLTNVTDALRDRLVINDQELFRYLSKVPTVVDHLNALLPTIDVGLDRIELRDTSEGPTLNFFHHGQFRPLGWLNESHGTRAFIKALPLIALALEHGTVTILDELDQALHPLLLREVVTWFYSAERNPKDAQLWLTCHSASLLDDLAKEEVVFCEKDQLGRTRIYRLADIEDVRPDQNFHKKYLSGLYGAVPAFG